MHDQKSMLSTYYLTFLAEPLEDSDQYEKVSSATICCWIIAKNEDDAHRKAVFEIEKLDWRITGYRSYATAVTRDDFLGKDIGSDAFDKCQKYGRAVVFVGVARDGKTEAGPIELKPKKAMDIAAFIKQQKRNSQRGRCLHYNAGTDCSNISMAHSIQRGKLLSEIARNGHVYGINRQYGALKRNAGRQSYCEIGINEISTFLGFCNKHDNELFRPIDDNPLVPSEEQALLYAYRSICKELFAKQNALDLYAHELQGTDQPAVRSMFLSLAQGTSLGLRELEVHKSEFDSCLKNAKFGEVRYVVFRSSRPPNLVFSGLLYPDFDFTGNQLQDLLDPTGVPDLITFSSAWTNGGWGYIFAWHRTSSATCERLVESLQKAALHNGNYEDYLFRLAVGCENHAIAPSWWESLKPEIQDKIAERISDTADVFADVDSRYLSSGLEAMSGWHFDEIISNIGINKLLA